MLFDEAQLVTERVNSGHITFATLLRLAVSSILSKKADKVFKAEMKKLAGD